VALFLVIVWMGPMACRPEGISTHAVCLICSLLYRRTAPIDFNPEAVGKGDQASALVISLSNAVTSWGAGLAQAQEQSPRLDTDQLQLALEEIEQAVAKAEAEIEKRAATRMRAAKPRSGERQSLPRALVSADQRRRRPVPVITSMRRMSAALGSSVWSSI
jgi:hypothetical protein